MILPGFPATRALSGTTPDTTELGPTVTHLPRKVPATMTAPLPTQLYTWPKVHILSDVDAPCPIDHTVGPYDHAVANAHTSTMSGPGFAATVKCYPSLDCDSPPYAKKRWRLHGCARGDRPSPHPNPHPVGTRELKNRVPKPIRPRATPCE
jgi:hypothetical protein